MSSDSLDGALILVTGASGFIATHIIKQLMERGLRVRGTVRSVKDEKRVRPLRELVPNPKHAIELVEADLLNENSWLEAVKDCDYVLHTASPVPSKVPKDADELVKPAVNGTLNVFKACVQPGAKVKRVVLTSSLAAIAGDEFTTDKIYSEKDWGNPDISQPYTKSKILAEKAAWTFLKQRQDKGEPCFELAVINPGVVLGPVLHDVLAASMEPVKLLLERQMSMLPDIAFPSCDVRDVARAHLVALESPEAAGNRHMIITDYESYTIKDAAVWLSSEFGPKGYKVPTTVAPNFLIKLASIFDKRVAFVKPILGKKPKFDSSRFKKVLNITPIETKKTILEMGHSMIERGFINKP